MQANVTELSHKIHPTDNQDSEAYLFTKTQQFRAKQGPSFKLNPSHHDKFSGAQFNRNIENHIENLVEILVLENSFQ